jgi:hypothetical protein
LILLSKMVRIISATFLRSMSGIFRFWSSLKELVSMFWMIYLMFVYPTVLSWVPSLSLSSVSTFPGVLLFLFFSRLTIFWVVSTNSSSCFSF